MNRRLCVVVAMAAVLGMAAVSLAQPAGSAAQKPATGGQPEDAWYKATRVAERVWRIDDRGNDNMYLIEGTKQALLVDTGLGVARLGPFVKTLTALPIIVVNTHAHPDHSGGNNFFPTVYVDPNDLDAVRPYNTPENRRGAVERMAKTNPPVPGLMSAEEAGRLAAPTLLPLKDGQLFDLGGRTIEILAQPGHTPGEIVLLDKASRLAFGGDNNNTLVWLFLPNSRPLEVYLASLKKMKQRAADFDTILPGHGGPLPASHLDAQIACVEDILAGRCTGEPYKAGPGSAQLCAHGPASVAFNPKNLRAGQ